MTLRLVIFGYLILSSMAFGGEAASSFQEKPSASKENLASSEDSAFGIEDLSDFLVLGKLFTDQYLMAKLDPILKNEIEIFFEKMDQQPSNSFAEEWIHEVSKDLVSKAISSLTKTTYLKAIPNVLQGKSVFGNFSGALLRKNHIPYELLETGEPVFLSQKIGFRFLRIGPKATNKWLNFFKMMALSATENFTDAVAHGSASAVTSEILFAQMYNINMLKRQNISGEYESLSSFKKMETDGRFGNLAKILVSRSMYKVMEFAGENIKDYLLPNHQLTGFYTIKDGVIYHVEYDIRGERQRTIEKAANKYSYLAPGKAKEYIELGMLTISKPVFARQTVTSYALNTAKNIGSFMVDEIIDFYLNSGMTLMYRAIDFHTGHRISDKIYGEGKNASFYNRFASDMTRQAKSSLVDMIRETIIKPAAISVWNLFTGRESKDENGYIAAITYLNNEFYYLQLTEQYRFKLIGD